MIESMLLNHRPVPFGHCPRCDAQPFEPFLRGGILRWRRQWLIGRRIARSAIVCSACRSIVGWEPAPFEAKFFGGKIHGLYEREMTIRPYDGTTKVATGDPRWSTKPDATSEFRVFAGQGYQADPATRPATMTPPPGARSHIVQARKP